MSSLCMRTIRPDDERYPGAGHHGEQLLQLVVTGPRSDCKATSAPSLLRHSSSESFMRSRKIGRSTLQILAQDRKSVAIANVANGVSCC